MVPCTISAPAITPARELATASSQSLCVWMPTRVLLPMPASAVRTAFTPSSIASGWLPPLVSQRTTHDAPARRAEGGQPRVAERLCREAGEQLLVLRVRPREAALDIVEAQAVEDARDALLVRGRERDGRTLRAVAQRRVVDDNRLPGGHKKTSRPCLGREVHRISDAR